MKGVGIAFRESYRFYRLRELFPWGEEDAASRRNGLPVKQI
jgi:hypothetical protein